MNRFRIAPARNPRGAPSPGTPHGLHPAQVCKNRYPAFAVLMRRRAPNRWDALALGLLFCTAIVVLQTARETSVPLATLQQHPISLDPALLPDYALRTTMRMLAAMVASLVFTFAYGTLAARNRRAETVLVPLLDILQSVPILSYLSFTVVGFLALFPGSVMGAELAAIFAVFTSQAWNMTFSFYQSLKTVPRDLDEAARGFRLTGWQRFWRLDVPFAIPGLVWNMMMSMSGGWFFVVATEAISVGNTQYALPGIGSWVALALEQRDMAAVGWAIAAMLAVIVAYDQLLFRPLVAWSAKFRVEWNAAAAPPRSWLLTALRRTRWMRRGIAPLLSRLGWLATRPLRTPLLATRRKAAPAAAQAAPPDDRLWHAVVGLAILASMGYIVHYLAQGVAWADVGSTFSLGFLTMLRVVALMAITSLVWVPVGVWIGLRPRVAERVQPLAQFLAAFPANLLFPFAVLAIVRWQLAPDIWLSPLMILGTQWYILFNVIAGASAFPGDLREAATDFHVHGWAWWRKVMLPGIFPYYLTGAITASGGCWNAAIVAELIHWGDTTVRARGLGAYIADATTAGDHHAIVLGTLVMCLYVIFFNRALWSPLYSYTERRLRID